MPGTRCAGRSSLLTRAWPASTRRRGPPPRRFGRQAARPTDPGDAPFAGPDALHRVPTAAVSSSNEAALHGPRSAASSPVGSAQVAAASTTPLPHESSSTTPSLVAAPAAGDGSGSMVNTPPPSVGRQPLSAVEQPAARTRVPIGTAGPAARSLAMRSSARAAPPHASQLPSAAASVTTSARARGRPAISRASPQMQAAKAISFSRQNSLARAQTQAATQVAAQRRPSRAAIHLVPRWAFPGVGKFPRRVRWKRPVVIWRAVGLSRGVFYVRCGRVLRIVACPAHCCRGRASPGSGRFALARRPARGREIVRLRARHRRARRPLPVRQRGGSKPVPLDDRPRQYPRPFQRHRCRPFRSRRRFSAPERRGEGAGAAPALHRPDGLRAQCPGGRLVRARGAAARPRRALRHSRPQPAARGARAGRRAGDRHWRGRRHALLARRRRLWWSRR